MFPSGLSMLWESTDAEEAFRSRFGFVDFDDGVAWLTRALFDRWALTVRGCERIVISDRNVIAWVDVTESSRRLICKWSRAENSFARLAAATDLITSLDGLGVPVAAPLLTRNGAGREIIDGPLGPLSVSVQPAIDGAPLDVDDESAVRAAGVQLALLHRAMAAVSNSGARATAGSPTLDLHARIRGWMDGWTARSVSDAAAVERLRRELALLPPLDSPPQLVHSDYRSANLVTEGSAIVAILDFDDVAWDYRVSDLAHTGIFLGTLFRDWRPTSPEARRLLVDAYQSVQPLTQLEHEWLDFLTRWYGLAAGWPVADAQNG